jgi:hypothetical protein
MDAQLCTSGNDCCAPEEVRGKPMPFDKLHRWRASRTKSGYSGRCLWCMRRQRNKRAREAKPCNVRYFVNVETGEERAVKYYEYYAGEPSPPDGWRVVD